MSIGISRAGTHLCRSPSLSARTSSPVNLKVEEPRKMLAVMSDNGHTRSSRFLTPPSLPVRNYNVQMEQQHDLYHNYHTQPQPFSSPFPPEHETAYYAYVEPHASVTASPQTVPYEAVEHGYLGQELLRFSNAPDVAATAPLAPGLQPFVPQNVVYAAPKSLPPKVSSACQCKNRIMRLPFTNGLRILYLCYY